MKERPVELDFLLRGMAGIVRMKKAEMGMPKEERVAHELMGGNREIIRRAFKEASKGMKNVNQSVVVEKGR